MNWSDEEISILQKHYNESYSQLQKRINRSVRAIKHKIADLGLQRAERKRWSVRELKVLEENTSMSAKELAEKLGRSEFQVAHRLRGIRGTANRRLKVGWNNPSKELAYFLGAWCSDGHCGEYTVEFAQKKEDEKFLDVISMSIENLFGIPTTKKDGKYVHLWACSTEFAKEIFSYNGVIAKPDWGTLIEKKYSWVLGDEYFWHFIGGLYDGDGSLSIGYRESTKDGIWRSFSLGIKPKCARELIQREMKKKGFEWKDASWDEEGVVESIALSGKAEKKKQFTEKIQCVLARKLKREGNGFEEISRQQANEFLGRFHYLKDSVRPGSICYGGLKDGVLVGVAVFASPISYIEQVRLLGEDNVKKVWELSRFATQDGMGKNFESALLAKALGMMSERAWVVLTYADSKVGHTGTLYKATNGYYFGLTKSKKHKFVFLVAKGDEKSFAKSVFMAKNAKRLKNYV